MNNVVPPENCRVKFERCSCHESPQLRKASIEIIERDIDATKEERVDRVNLIIVRRLLCCVTLTTGDESGF